MSLLSFDDFADVPGSDDAVWVEGRVRVLVPRSALGKGMAAAIRGNGDDAPWTVDSLTSALMGQPVECKCGKVAIHYGQVYVWGRDQYGKRDETHRVPGQYCPHCDGGEDMG